MLEEEIKMPRREESKNSDKIVLSGGTSVVPGVLKTMEHSSYYIDLLSKYFSCVAAHSEIIYHDPKVPSSDESKCLIFSGCSRELRQLDCVSCNMKQEVLIPFTAPSNELGSCWDDLISSQIEFISRACVKLKLNELVCGGYCPKLKVLVLSDFTHDYTATQHDILSSMLSSLEHFGLVPLSKVKKRKRAVKVTIGCDPEFEVFIGGRIVRAEDYTPGYHEDVGCDGAGSQLEIRPEPSVSHVQLVRNIHNLLMKASRVYHIIGVKGDHDPLGGHIHFGIFPSGNLIKMLDDFIGKPLRSESGHARHGYNRLSAIEPKPWGFEYRTPPSAWLCFPEIARIVLKIARGVANYYVNHRRIVYNRRLKYEDYKRICGLSRREYKLFRAFATGKLRNHYYNILGNWGIPTSEGYKLSIGFSDEWSLEITRIVLKELEMYLNHPYDIVLFGLRRERGKQLYGFRLDGYSQATDISRPSNCFGLPYSFRKGLISREEFDRILLSLKAAIIEELDRHGIKIVDKDKMFKKVRRKPGVLPRKIEGFT